MRAWLIVILLAGAIPTVSGCGPSVSREELGEVIFELPKVPPRELPKTDQPAAGSDASGATTQPPSE
jgi:hypothetical protein